MAKQPFFRAGQPVRVPVSLGSETAQFDLTGKIPNFTDLTFIFVNPCPFDIRLEGTPMKTDGSGPASFMQVTASTGWLIEARTTLGPFTSKKPGMLSAMPVPAPGLPLPDAAWFAANPCYLELIYGRGE